MSSKVRGALDDALQRKADYITRVRSKCRNVSRHEIRTISALICHVHSAEALDKRALDVRRMLRARKEELVTVVCHAVGLPYADAYAHAECVYQQGFIKHLVLLPHDHRWHNAEARVYRFDDSSEQAKEEAMLQRIPVDEERELLGGTQAIIVESW